MTFDNLCRIMPNPQQKQNYSNVKNLKPCVQ